MLRMRTLLLLAVPAWFSATGAQELSPVNNMCSRWYHRSTIKENILYIDGGLESYHALSGSVIVNGYNEALITVDMSGPWNWKSQNIFENTIDKSSGTRALMGSSPPNLISGALYQGSLQDHNIYFYGGTTSYWNTSFPGWQAPSSSRYGLWSYDISASTWMQYDISSGSVWRPSRGYAAEAVDQGLAFHFNGVLDRGSSAATTGFDKTLEVYLEGMIVLDTNTQAATNVSTITATGDSPQSGGGMIYIPSYGEHGILVAFAGTSAPSGNADGDELEGFMPMNETFVYDVNAYYNGSNGWYKQAASGDIPGPRADTCVAVASLPDNLSHDIYVYGGRGPSNITYDDVYVLSIPSFVWTRIFGPGGSPRYGHTCHIIGNQLITVGGLSSYETCDWEYRGVAVLDMSIVNWTSVYEPNTPAYTLPSAVRGAISK